MKYTNFKTLALILSTSVLLALTGCGNSGTPSDDNLVGGGIVNKAPIADAGADQSVTEGDTVTLDGSGSSDPDGTIVSYEWVEGSTVLSTAVSFSKSDFSVGTHTVTLTVTDNNGTSASDSMTVTVNAANVPPVADAGADQTITEGDTVTLNGSGSNDPDGTIVSYEWKEGSTVLSTAVSFSKSDFSVGTHTITLTVTDNDGASASDSVTVTVNAAPSGIPVADAGADQTIGICDTLILDGNGSHDPDGNIVHYAWSLSDDTIIGEGNTSSLIMRGLKIMGEQNITLTVTDNDGLIGTDIVTVTIMSADEDYDFSYIIKDPYDASALSNIVSSSNAVLETEPNYNYWKSDIGGTYRVNTTPGLIDLYFNFPTKVETAHLSTGVYTFHWSYSEGHAYLHGSVDGTVWEQLAEATPPEYSGYNYGGYNDFLPDTMVGTNDLWFRAELYSYGSSASYGGVYTNTAQFLRYDRNRDSTTFKLNVCYEK